MSSNKQDFASNPPTYGSPAPNQPYNADSIGTHSTGQSYYGGPQPTHDAGPAPAQGYYAGQQPMGSPPLVSGQHGGSYTGGAYGAHGSPTQGHGYTNQTGGAYEMQQPGQPAGQPAGQGQYGQGYGQPQSQQQQHHAQDGSGKNNYGGGAPPQGQNQNQPPGYSQYRTAIPLSNLQSAPAPVDCPNCHQRAMTATHLETGNTTNAWAAVLCIVTCLGCIPYCISSLKDVVHKCGNCGATLATWHRSGRTVVHLHA